jgi:hydroxymethylpyrimidine pyrophosphatase-like HAD family hydrolase
MASKKISLLLSDVDGTLLDSKKRITARAKAAIEKVREVGIKFAMTSGRQPRGMKMIVEQVKLSAPMAAFNGGTFVELEKVLHRVGSVEPARGWETNVVNCQISDLCRHKSSRLNLPTNQQQYNLPPRHCWPAEPQRVSSRPRLYSGGRGTGGEKDCLLGSLSVH